VIAAVIWATAFVLVRPMHAAASGDAVAAASSGHLWFVRPAEESKAGFELCHHSPLLEGPFFRVQAILAHSPVAMAAQGDRVWLVFPPKDESGNSAREVYTVQAQFNPAFGNFFVLPTDRMEPVASLPGSGRLASFIGSREGPAALLSPSPRSRRGSESASPDTARILQLSGNQWMDLPMPSGLDPNRPSLLAAAGPDGSSFVLLTAVSGERQILRHDRSPAGQWTQSTLDADLRRIAGIARLDSQIVAAIEDTATDSVLIAYLRASAVLPVATLPQPKRSFWVFPRGAELVMLQAAGPRSFSLTEIRPVDGSFGPTEQLVPQPMSATRVWQCADVRGQSPDRHDGSRAP
jgi:hypothetical protein